MGGDSRVGPSPPSERPELPQSLQTHTERDQRLASFRCRPACCIACSALPCLAMPRLPASTITPCLLALFALYLCHHHHERQDHLQCFAKTALQAASPRDCIKQPMHRLLHSVHFVFCICPFPFHEPETAVSSLATSSCTKEQETALGSLATYSNDLWDGIWHAVLG